MIKAHSVSQDTFARMSNEKIYESALNWANNYRNEYVSLLENNKDICITSVGIERNDGNDPKRFVTYEDVINHCKLFIDSEYHTIEYPQNWTSLTSDQIKAFIDVYQ